MNVLAPLALIQRALPALRATGGTIVNVTSDAAVEGYEGWGGYGSSKAALEQLTNVLAAEEPGLRVHRFDPGDMRTRMHQDAFPDEDISDRPEPEEQAVPALVAPDRAGDRRAVATGSATSWKERRNDAWPTRDRERLRFDLPPELEAREPPEAARHATRRCAAARRHRRGRSPTRPSRASPSTSQPGDLVVVNTSATIPAAVDATAPDGTAAGPAPVVRSRRTASGWWSPAGPTGRPRAAGRVRSRVTSSRCAAARQATLLGRYRGGRLWAARLDVGLPVLDVADQVTAGRSATATCPHPWPLDTYQNVYASEPGSAEMPSAGRPFTAEVLGRLVAAGVGVAPLVLHTGVASLEADELPYPERFAVPADHRRTGERHPRRRPAGSSPSARPWCARSRARSTPTGGRVPPPGWTDLVITPERGVRLVDGLLTGWHEPEASHLLMLEAVAGRDLVARSYEAGLAHGYRWHEFGDSHLLLPTDHPPFLRRNRLPWQPISTQNG